MRRRRHRLHDGKAGSALAIRVTPRAGRDRISQVLGDGTVKIQLATAPVDGQANEKLVSFLSGVLGVARSRIEIVAGATGRNKLVSVLGIDAATVHDRIVSSLD